MMAGIFRQPQEVLGVWEIGDQKLRVDKLDVRVLVVESFSRPFLCGSEFEFRVLRKKKTFVKRLSTKIIQT